MASGSWEPTHFHQRDSDTSLVTDKPNSYVPAGGASASTSTKDGHTLETKLVDIFEGMTDEVRRQSVQSAIVILQGMLQSIPSNTQTFVDDPENEIPDGPILPFLVSHPDRPGYILPFSDSLASTRIYDRRWTVLPNRVANFPCDGETPATLLNWLNTLFDTKFMLSHEVETCLEEFIDDGCDLGQLYGYMRPWMRNIYIHAQFANVPATMRKHREEDFELRSKAITSNRITTPKLPPRRVWDLYANRVLPYHALKPETTVLGSEHLPHRFWAVSHSWVSSSERQSVLSTINGKAWRVPIPLGTTLCDIRNELLALGAEYVFLDVLCLRQKDEHLPEFESIRKREWRLDVPTIGHIYNEDPTRPVIVYFNGLGLSFRDGGANYGDRFHWFNRAWTLQECPYFIIPAGLKGKIGKVAVRSLDPEQPPLQWASREFLHRLKTESVRDYVLRPDMKGLVEKVTSRVSSNPVDKVACLAYLLACPTLPIYDADMDVEVVWSLLVECLPDHTRTQLLFSEFGRASRFSSWRPSWEQIVTCSHIPESLEPPPKECLKYLEASSPVLGYRHGFDVYYHRAYIIEGCRIHLPESRSSEDAMGRIDIPLAGGTGYGTFEISEWGQSIVLDTAYVLISVGGLEYWLVAQVEGIRRIDGEKALEVSKVSTLMVPGVRPHKLLELQLRSTLAPIVYR